MSVLLLIKLGTEVRYQIGIIDFDQLFCKYGLFAYVFPVSHFTEQSCTYRILTQFSIFNNVF